MHPGRLTILMYIYVAILLTGCAPRMAGQAPFDAFVCFKSSFNRCLQDAQGGKLRDYYAGAAKSSKLPGSNNNPTEPPSPTDDVGFHDQNQGAVRTTSDKKYSCSFGAVPYTQAINASVVVDVVFVSPVLLRQLAEQALRLERARQSCDQIVKAYDTQLELIAKQDTLSIYQRAATELAAKVEAERAKKDNVGSGALSPDEASRYHLDNSMSGRDALQKSRVLVLDSADTVRNVYRTQTLDVDYARQFMDTQLSIDLATRDVAKTLFMLDRSIASKVGDGIRSDYTSGSWVKQGTVVYTAKPQTR